ncbi:HSR1-like GTP-binding protein [Gottschalkia acidurici 9a]|uniref:HSR1-like GTP-binding protein n=1 Tax=Gottschalkia acidurici (strain ATCC 7906 / DSM 604 / BCRC 14475 / CIP 104303 / KCTC 5404 / NCIMB 10678 / 9a) TaxID=1128398 RepID=K0B1H0_GOTA9|nr:GTPase domain-containing protein [Gottschalkia acidurici]AFS78531.1 HSR1-like GTP-binding protein [Gottschalkia acidurici 9a]
MKNAIIIGKTNVGKSLFLVNFAEYLGYEKVYITIEYPDGKKLNKQMSTELAKKYLSSSKDYKTRALQSLDIKLPVYKGKKEIKVVDSSGLADGIHPDISVRNSMIQTLEMLFSSDIIIHIVDVTDYLDSNNLWNNNIIDRQLADYGIPKYKYLLLANKIDLDENEDGLNNLSKFFPKVKIIPVSALYKKGFKEVKDFVFKYI